MIRQLLSSLAITSITLLLLTGCGSAGNEAVKAAGNTTNSFARNTVTADEEIIDGGTSNTTSCSNTSTSGTTYCLAVEATDAMIASWQSDLFDLLTPAKAYAFRGLTTVPAKQVRVIQVDENLNEVTSSLLPSYSVQENSTLGTYSITFESTPPSRINFVAKITLNNDEVLYSPFIVSGSTIIVNVVSDYVVKQLFNQLTTPSQLARLLPCNDGGSEIGNNADCTNQPFAKYSLWGGLNGIAQNYEIDIPTAYTISQAFDLLSNTGDFNNHIETVINEMLRETTDGPFVGATERTLDLTDPDINLENLSTVAHYNSALFTLGFNQVAPDATSPDASISTAISTVSEEPVGDDISYTYPELIRNTANLYVANSSLTGDFPFLRTSLAISSDNQLNVNTTPTNSFSSAPGNTFLTTQGFYVAGKIPFQTITDKTDTTGVGWQFDPYTHLVYSSGADSGKPDSLLSSFVSNGSSYFITGNGSSTWDRQSKSEEQNLFSWTVHNEKTDENFTTNTISSKNYGVVSFSVKLNNTGDIVTTSGKLLHWNASSASQIDESQPAITPGGGAEPHYQTYTFSRDENQTLSVLLAASDPNTIPRSYNTIDTIKSSDQGQQAISQGRLEVFAPNSPQDKSLASSTPDGGMITVTLNEAGAGQGLIQASELRTVAPNLDTDPDLVYRLAGNSFGASASHNILRNYGNSTITFTGNSSAVLTLNSIESTHNVSSQAVSGLSQRAGVSNIVGSYVVNDNGLIQLNFPGIDSETLQFKGFMSNAADGATNAPGNLMTLLMIHEYDAAANTQATLGLVHAFKEQSLPVWEETAP